MARRSKSTTDQSETAPAPAKSGGGMRILTLLLALYGAAMATLAYSKAGSGGTGGGDAGKDGLDARFAKEASTIRSEVLADIKEGVSKAKELCALEGKKAAVEAATARTMKEALEGQGEAAAQAIAKRSEVLEAHIDDVTKDSTLLKETVATLGVEVRDLRSRPMAAGPGPAPRDPAPVVKPPTSVPGAVEPPAAPVGPTPEELAANKEKVRALIAELDSPDVGKVFTACSKLGKFGDLEAVPQLMKVAKEHKDPLARSAALSALGKLHACDAVPVILAAMLEKDASVMLMAGQAFGQISGLDSGLSGDASRKDRNEAKDRWTKWWTQHETEVRDRLKQPAGAGAQPVPSGGGAVPVPPGGAAPDAGK